jgi:DNA-binding NtrC family response regulator
MIKSELRHLLLVDGDPAQTRLITALCSREGWRTITVSGGDEALAALDTREGLHISAVVVDQSIAGEDTAVLLARLKEKRPALAILVLTASTSPQLAVEAMRAGATDYLVKPVAPERLMLALRNTAARETPRDELVPLTEKIAASLDFDAMVGTAPSFRAALAKAAKAARGHGNVLIEGESGTGKEMLIRAMYAASPRSKMPFRMINISGLPAGTLESTLFGHEKGAFPGAFESKVGALQHCDGGTLVLDEVDRLPVDLQDRLIVALSTDRVRPIGAAHSFRVDVRVISASNLPLSDLVAGEHFRAELLELLAATRIEMPALRERNGDIRALVQHFLARIGEQPGLRHLGITEDALRLLAAFDWPGNVRQLQAVLFRAAVFCDGDALTERDFPQLAEIVADAPDAPQSLRHAGGGVDIYSTDQHVRTLAEIEADVIRLAIGHYRGRMSEVARRLGIGRSTLYRKLGELGIDKTA